MRARILYNHLYFSDLPQPYKDAVLDGDFFLQIIKHQHFNPRLIEWLSTYTRLREVGSDAYQAHISALLESPEAIWDHAFRNQLSDAARHVLLCLYTLGEWGSDIVNIEPAFISLHRYSAAKYNVRIAAGDFRRSLQELDGAFLSYRSGHAEYLNPSIREFVASVISDDRDIGEDLLNTSIRFKQVVNLWKLSTGRRNSTLSTLVTANIDLLGNAACRLLYGPSIRWEKMRDGSQRGYYIDMSDEERIRFLAGDAEPRRQASTSLCDGRCRPSRKAELGGL
jgi:hypothetical protein